LVVFSRGPDPLIGRAGRKFTIAQRNKPGAEKLLRMADDRQVKEGRRPKPTPDVREPGVNSVTANKSLDEEGDAVDLITD
jgi:hypothetical protein